MWFITKEYLYLVAALEAKDKEAIVIAAELINSVLLVAAANVLKTIKELLVALLEETRVIRREIASLINS